MRSTLFMPATALCLTLSACSRSPETTPVPAAESNAAANTAPVAALPQTAPTQAWSEEELAKIVNAQIAVTKLTVKNSDRLQQMGQTSDQRTLRELEHFQNEYRQVVQKYGYDATAYEARLADLERSPELKARLLAIVGDKFDLNTPVEDLTPAQIRELLNKQQQ